MLILTRHAQQNVARDRLDLARIEATITRPQYADREPKDATLTRAWRSIPERGGRLLRVVFRPVRS
jgi:Domain of unknown function (DUF4258)